MEDLINIIVENYIIILVVIGVIIMIVVGYIADKTDFWHKKKGQSGPEKKQEEKEEKEQEVDLNNLENKKLSDIYPDADNNLSNPSNEDLNSLNNSMDLNAPFGDTISATKINNPVKNEDLNAPFGDGPISAPTPNLAYNEPTTLTNYSSSNVEQTDNGNLFAPLDQIQVAQEQSTAKPSEDLYAPLPTGESNDTIKIVEMPTKAEDEQSVETFATENQLQETPVVENVEVEPINQVEPTVEQPAEVIEQPIIENIEVEPINQVEPTIEQPAEVIEQPVVENVEVEPINQVEPTIEQPTEVIEQPIIENIEVEPINQVESTVEQPTEVIEQPIIEQVDIQPEVQVVEPQPDFQIIDPIVEQQEVIEEPTPVGNPSFVPTIEIPNIENNIGQPVETKSNNSSMMFTDPIVPEFITEELVIDEDKENNNFNAEADNNESDGDIWKF